MSKQIEKILQVHAPVEVCYQAWLNFKQFPLFMKHVDNISRNPNSNTWHWELSGPLGQSLSWDIEIEHVEPNKVISWRSTADSSVATTGSVNFQPEPDGQTRIYFSMSFEPPRGGLGEFFAELFEDPDHMVDEDLCHFKLHVEQHPLEIEGLEPEKNIDFALHSGFKGEKGRLNQQL